MTKLAYCFKFHTTKFWVLHFSACSSFALFQPEFSRAVSSHHKSVLRLLKASHISFSLVLLYQVISKHLSFLEFFSKKSRNLIFNLILFKEFKKHCSDFTFTEVRYTLGKWSTKGQPRNHSRTRSRRKFAETNP